MSSWAIRTEQDREQIIKLISGREMPCTVNITKGAPRSIEQNKLQRKWLLEAQEQGDQTAEEYRAYCKAYFGVPILMAELDGFKESFQRITHHLSYEEKLDLMAAPLDFPVTRLMSTKQKSAYLDKVYGYFTGLGFQLTEPA